MKIFRIYLLLLCGLSAWAGEATRAGQEARALAALAAMPDGARREAGLKVVRAAWQRFRSDATAAEQSAAADEPPRLADLRERNAGLAGLRRLSADQGPAAVAALTEAHLARWPLDDEARSLLGLGKFAAGDRDAAVDALLTVQACDPSASAARELRGRLYVDDADAAVAEQAAADLASLVTGLLADGCRAEAAGEGVAGQRALDALLPVARAVRGSGPTGQLAALRGAAAERAQDWPQALSLWRTAATAGLITPNAASHVRALVRRLRAADVDPAIASGDVGTLSELSPAFPERDDLQDRLFRALLTSGQFGEVRRAANALLEADPQHAFALLAAEAAAAAVDPRRMELVPPMVVRVRLAAPTLGERFPVMYGLDAAMAEISGDLPGAISAMDRLLELRPDDRTARWQRARLRLRSGDRGGALADCNALLVSVPDDPDALSMRSRVRADTGDRVGALADADRVVALRPGCPALLARARVRKQLGDETALTADLDALIAAARDGGDSLILIDALDVTADAAMQRKLLERASQLGNADASLRLRRMR